MTRLIPLPDAEGIAKTQDLVLNRFGKRLTEQEAADLLGRLMRLLYFTSGLSRSPDASPPTMASTPGGTARIKPSKVKPPMPT